MNIAMSMLAEAGHHAGAFGLARRLVQAGHRVVFIGLAECRAWVTAQGFEFIAFAEDLLPAGSGHNPGRSRREREKLFGEFLQRIVGGELDHCLTECQAQVLLCDTFTWYTALRAIRLGIPTINLSVILSSRPNEIVPPIVTDAAPARSSASRVRIRASWIGLRVKHFFTKRLASKLTGAFRAPTRMHHLIDVFRSIARQSSFPCVENETYWFGEMGPRLALPEIVLCPRCFQFVGDPDTERVYAGHFVDLNRVEPTLEAPITSNGSPLVLCSLGSSATFYPHRQRFFRAIEEASRLRPDWMFVVHSSDPEYTASHTRSANFSVYAQVPQLELLKKASAMVTHGGINSIMECIEFGVPMVIVPAMRDQPGNAARAIEHGIARTTRMPSLTGEILAALVADAMRDDAMKSALARMKQAVASESGMDKALRLIERQVLR